MTHELITAFAEFLDSGRWLKVLLFLTGLMILTILIQIQRGHNRIDFKDILVDENGKASPTRSVPGLALGNSRPLISQFWHGAIGTFERSCSRFRGAASALRRADS